ncbi:type I secretion protein [Sulfitobacter sp. SK012]|uniref:calcium-binding protein n=1 Tax=Sulfitobacter sp. SK012 TaxID=1389005 RepID=UPI000E0C126B|nr:calcium-binding protein [Sulfitobacter sp. SK012]AXI48642.1 type I secretion protein [Sulfitobacter sp. SK012]
MNSSQTTNQQTGTNVSEVLDGTNGADLVQGLSGNDTITSGDGNDVVFGDFTTSNLLSGTDGASSFTQYGESGAWIVQEEAGGHTSMTQVIDTEPGEAYEINFDLAANYGAQSVSGAVEVLWNGEVIDSFDTNSATFAAHGISFQGAGGPGELTFRSIESTNASGPVVNTDGPIFYTLENKEIGNQSVEVKTFAEGQTGIYQVINGTLQVFDPVDATYTVAGSPATVTVNAIGFNVQDNLIYGLAVGNGVDSLGNAVEKTDLIMLDAAGDSYKIGSTPYRSWTGDFDSNGNLWAFQSSMDSITMIDVNSVDANGDVATKTFKFPKDMITDQLWDVAYDATSQSFMGVTRPTSEGATSTMYVINVSEVANGGEPTFETHDVTGTLIDGVMHDGVPAITFGAAIQDADGNFYVAGNSGDHDMNDSTASAGGIYRVVMDAGSETAHLELVATSPRSSSNDGTSDPRAMDPFSEIDVSASVLIRNLDLTIAPNSEETYDDVIENGSGADQSDGGIGQDTIAGQSGNDTLIGGEGDDELFGGNSTQNSPVEIYTYDEFGNRYDAGGNLLPEENDELFGGAGNDIMHGGSGHDSLDGGTGNDNLNGGSGSDVLNGGTGNDVLASGSESDVVHGGEGDDQLIGGSGDDALSGDDGIDDLAGGTGADTLDGGAGDDLLNGGIGDDILIGGTGDDVLNGSTGNDTLSDVAGDNTMNGGSGHDNMTGGSGVDNIIGGSGDDVLSGEGERDVLKGGTGDDTLNGGDDKDKLYGGNGNDIINGDQGSDYINAGHGDDVINAGQGRDKVLSGTGSDDIWGGADTDWFVFLTSDANNSTDTLFDYTHDGVENDRLDLRSFDALGNGMSTADWINDHITQNADNSVTIDLGNLAINLIDHADIQDQFFDQVLDGLQL